MVPKISQQEVLLVRQSALGKLGKIKTFTVRGLINFFFLTDYHPVITPSSK